MFSGHQMKKVNLKAKRQNAPSSSKQMTLDKFFKNSPNKENLKDEQHSTSVNSGAEFLCHADIHSQELQKNASLTAVNTSSDTNREVLSPNSGSFNSCNSSTRNKRKSSGSSDSPGDTKKESFADDGHVTNVKRVASDSHVVDNQHKELQKNPNCSPVKSVVNAVNVASCNTPKNSAKNKRKSNESPEPQKSSKRESPIANCPLSGVKKQASLLSIPVKRGKEPQKISNRSPANSVVNANREVSLVNGANCNTPKHSAKNKRKSKELPELQKSSKKESLIDNCPLSGVKRQASFSGDADKHGKEPQKNSNRSPANSIVNANRKVSLMNNANCNAHKDSTKNNRKSNDSPDSQKNTKKESLIDDRRSSSVKRQASLCSNKHGKEPQKNSNCSPVNSAVNANRKVPSVNGASFNARKHSANIKRKVNESPDSQKSTRKDSPVADCHLSSVKIQAFFSGNADKKGKERQKISSCASLKHVTDVNKELDVNDASCDLRKYSTTIKRKSSGSLDSQKNSEDEFSPPSDLKTKADEFVYPNRKKVNLNSSAESIADANSAKKLNQSKAEPIASGIKIQCAKELDQSKTEHIASGIEMQCAKNLPKTLQAKEIRNGVLSVSDKSSTCSKDATNLIQSKVCPIEKCKDESASIAKCTSNNIIMNQMVSNTPEKSITNPSSAKNQSCGDGSSKSSINLSSGKSCEDLEHNFEATCAKSVTLNSVTNQNGEIIGGSLQKELTGSNLVNNKMSDLNASFGSHFNDDLVFEDWDLSTQDTNRVLTLDTMKRCKITEVKTINYDKVITLQSLEDKNASAVCKLRGAWFHTIIETNDIVNIVAELRSNEWIVDNAAGLLVLNPDTLISSTSLMGSMFCRRKAVLASSFQVQDSGAKAMVIGCLVHSLLQKVMADNIRCEKKIREVIDDLVFDPSMVHSLLLLQTNFEVIKAELSGFVPEVIKFMETYVTPTSGSCSEDNWNGQITCIKDIEENIWSPAYGVKGKVDVTVEVHVDGVKRTMPIELKTGKSSNSAEHRGQVSLYVLMMAHLGYDVTSGLLLYLKDGQMKEVPVDHHVKRDIMMLRNDFVHFVTSNQTTRFLEDGSIAGPDLPEPIDHHSACGRCAYQTFCCAALVDNKMAGVDRRNMITNLSATCLNHLKLPHIRYVFHWIGLLKLEEADKKSRRNSEIKDLWCQSAKEREKSGACVANLSLVKVESSNNSFVHTFKFSCPTLSNNFNVGDCVVVSSDTRIAVAMGIILHITVDNISLSLEKDLRLKDDKVFHLDRYESQSFLNFNISNLCLLLENLDRSNKLREEIIDMKVPTFSKIQPKIADDIIRRLNDGQKRAVLRAFAADSYMLIQGMPGCGKTETLAALVKLLVENGQSVLITSHTHSAVDTLVRRLCGSVDLLRLGSKNKIHPSLHKYSDETFLSSSNYKSLEDIKRFYLSKKVVAVTVLGSSHPVLSLRKFDVCIVDEATQILQPSVLRPLMAASKFILVGDPLQLPPLVYSSLANSSGLSESLFIRLNRPCATVMLNTQYRMNERITSLANSFMYNGALKCANETVANNTLQFNVDSLEVETVNCSPWLKLALSCKMEDSVIFVDVKRSSTAVESEICVNHAEAKVLMVVLEALTKGGVEHDSIGVIAPYRAQVNLLRQLTVEKNMNIEVNTVDQYQGRDKDIILFSCTARGRASGKEGILSSSQRLSVAITRAKLKLIFFGDTTVLKSYKLFDTILQFISGDCITKT